jgi:PadR family transcriptional regulator PadR
MERPTRDRDEIPPGTLYLLILKTLAREPMHGYGIAERIRSATGEVLGVEEGSLYPALQRMLMKGWVTAKWEMTPNNHKARYYTLTANGRRQLGQEIEQFRRVMGAIQRAIQAT